MRRAATCGQREPLLPSSAVASERHGERSDFVVGERRARRKGSRWESDVATNETEGEAVNACAGTYQERVSSLIHLFLFFLSRSLAWETLLAECRESRSSRKKRNPIFWDALREFDRRKPGTRDRSFLPFYRLLSYVLFSFPLGVPRKIAESHVVESL